MTEYESKTFHHRPIEDETKIHHWLNPQQPILFYHSPPLWPPSPPAIKHERKPNQHHYIFLKGGRHGVH